MVTYKVSNKMRSFDKLKDMLRYAYKWRKKGVTVNPVTPYNFWWAVRDLNPRLPPCEDGTLPLS